MSSPELVMVGSYDYHLVALSVAIAVLASYAALDFAGRVTSAKGGIRFLWLIGGAVAMGIGIWSMHYIGMLAFRLPVPVRYDWPTVLVSLLAALFASAIALFVVSREKMGFIPAIVGSVFMGSAIAGMHYIGMAAMRLPAMCHFSLSIVMISVALAIVISLVALWLTFNLRGETRSGGWRKILSAVVMGAAIPLMHYTGMAAATFTVSDVALDLSHAVSVSALGTVGIAALTIMILGIAVLTSAYDRLLREPRTMRTRVLSVRIRALRTAMATFCVMFVFEAAKQAVQPKITIWTSHALTILFATSLAAVLSFIILRKEERFRFELASSEKEYRLLFDSNPLPTWVFSRETLKFLAVNEAAIRHYGFSRQEFLAMTIADIRPEEDIPALLESVAKRIHGLQEAKTWRHRKKDGTNIDVEIDGHELDFQGTEAELVTSHDVSERKQAERTTNLLAAIVDSSQDAIISKSLDGIISSWNKGAERLFGHCSETAIGQPITLIVPSDRRDEEATILERLKRGEWIEQYETVRVRKDGTPLHVALTISPVKDSTGRVVGASKVARDITERMQGEKALRQAKEKYRAIFEDAVVGIFQITPESRPLSINRALAQMHGYDSPEEFMVEISNMARQLFVDPSRMDELRQELAQKGEVRGAELEIYRRDRTKKWVAANIREVRDGDSKAMLLEGTVEDITDRKIAQERVQFLAYFDELTGLPNRTLLQDRLTTAVAGARRRKDKVALLFLDLDRFKLVNDSLGHPCGDLLLQNVAERLKGWARQQDTVARLGGDEFVIVLNSVKDVADAAVAAERLMDTMVAEFTLQGHSFNISCSLGISIFPEHGTDVETLMKNADAAMYCAKDSGRAKFRFFTEEMNAQVVERLTLESSLRQALGKKELFLMYQPQMDIATGRITGLEALLRWQHPELGLVPPDRFIRIAENSGLIMPIGKWVLRTACSQSRKWQDEGLPAVQMAVNVSAVQFRQEDFCELIRTVLHETGLAPKYLELEITEGLLLSNADVMFSVFQELKAMGLRLAIDDFGTGYSSLSYLKKFPVSKLKIDRSFVRDVAVNTDDAAITNAIISMAKSLNLKVIAEGVENEAQLSFLRAHQCDEIQGYYFSKPLLVGEVTEKFRGNALDAGFLLAETQPLPS
jgi:diguanylate cyclase (GGDEF)-like protein/PAS domain S-box-containing protein